MTTYDAKFFDYVNSGAARSAERVLPHLLQHLTISSVLDVGCGQGAWLSVWKKLGVNDIMGIDGDYVSQASLLIPPDSFKPADLAHGFTLGRRFDLVQCLEVAEHLPLSSSAILVDSLVEHGDIVLFSAAPKGQGGDHHINEQDYEFWRRQFARHGYAPFDFLRPLLLGDDQIEPWYRYNPFLYVSPMRIDKLPVAISCCRVPDKEKLRDLSPLPYQIRKWAVSFLPAAVMTQLAKIKESCVSWARRD